MNNNFTKIYNDKNNKKTFKKLYSNLSYIEDFKNEMFTNNGGLMKHYPINYNTFLNDKKTLIDMYANKFFVAFKDNKNSISGEFPSSVINGNKVLNFEEKRIVGEAVILKLNNSINYYYSCKSDANYQKLRRMMIKGITEEELIEIKKNRTQNALKVNKENTKERQEQELADLMFLISNTKFINVSSVENFFHKNVSDEIFNMLRGLSNKKTLKNGVGKTLSDSLNIRNLYLFAKENGVSISEKTILKHLTKIINTIVKTINDRLNYLLNSIKNVSLTPFKKLFNVCENFILIPSYIKINT